MAREPSLAVGKLRSKATKINVELHQRFVDVEPTDVIAEDWDNLLLCDACRFDMLSARNLDGELQERTSAGSHSWEFMEFNFAGRQLHDTVYVTANPHTYWLEKDVFHATVNLIEHRWNDEYGTVLPESVAEAAKTAHREYPDKRLIVHFMQPHFPFIGERGRKLRHGGVNKTGIATHENAARGSDGTGRNMTVGGGEMIRDGDRERVWLDPVDTDIWTLVQYGQIDSQAAIEAYKENLDVVLPHVTELLDALSGQSVVTADHGNLIGDRMWPIPLRGFGHPTGLYVPELVRVPWLVVQSTDRRSLTSEPPVEGENIEREVIDDRLRKLGYID